MKALIGLIFALTLTSSPGHADELRPNIIFIFSDDHAAQSIGAYGATARPTPNLDQLAREGAIFINNFSNNAICCPSRAAVLTGTHSQINQVYTNWNGLDPSKNTTFPEVLQAAGYQTALFGKWHLKFNPTGYEDWMIFPDQGDYYNPTYKTAQGNVKREGYSTDITTNLAMEWLEKRRDGQRPYLLSIQYKAPHQDYMPGPAELADAAYKGIDFPEPATLFDDYSTRSAALGNAKQFLIKNWDDVSEHTYTPSDKNAPKKVTKSIGRMNPEQLSIWKQYYSSIPQSDSYQDPKQRTRAIFQRFIKNYYMAVDGIDRNIGRLLNFLEENSLSKNTLIIYSSDHGYFLGEHGQRGKRWFYEETARMPLIIRWPESIKPGTRIEALTQNIDYAPFFADIAGSSMPDVAQGESFRPLLSQNSDTSWRDAIYYTYFQPNQGVEPHEGVRTQRYKLIHFYQINAFELYDLQNDPNELENLYLSTQHSDLRIKMKQLLDQKRTEYSAHSYDTLINENLEFRTPREPIKSFNSASPSTTVSQ
ncbi:sulfatase family protein [Coraliomargarita sp. W4R72]